MRTLQSSVRNKRFGLATNSSSTHSIIFNPEIASGNDTEADGSFGWGDFTLTTREAKKLYLLLQLKDNLNHGGRGIVQYLINEVDPNSPLVEGYIDHQSVWNLPKQYNWGSDAEVNIEFFQDLMNYILDDDFVILGGNDNSDGHPLASEDIGEKVPIDADLWGYYNVQAYKNGNYWVLISNKSKTRINFNTGYDCIPDRPELIDIKITDYCSSNCSFCYQGSSRNGEHASLKNIQTLAKYFGTWDTVTEYAIGGGEPTEHPEFAKILRTLAAGGNLVCFTTKTTSWMQDKDVVDAVNRCAAGVAYSLDSRNVLQKLFRYIRDHSKHCEDVSMYIHIIPEIMKPEDFSDVIKVIRAYNINLDYDKRIKITLLGFKTTGRGVNYECSTIGSTEHMRSILSKAKDAGVSIGIDTCISDRYITLLDELKIPDTLYTKNEGEFSMYIDAVKMQAHRSSYDIDTPINIPDLKRYADADSIFNKIREQGGFTIYEN